MRYRELGRTGLKVSEIGFGAEWIGKMDEADVRAMAARCAQAGVNLVDCWMSDPAVRRVRKPRKRAGGRRQPVPILREARASRFHQLPELLYVSLSQRIARQLACRINLFIGCGKAA